jgi:hypothetical protein
MAWSDEIPFLAVSQGNFTDAFAIGEKQIAHVQVCRVGTPSFVDPMDVHPQTSTDPNRAFKPWDTMPYKPKRVPKTEDVASIILEGPCNARIGIVNPGVTDTISANIYVKITGS